MDYSDIFWSVDHAQREMMKASQNAQKNLSEKICRQAEFVFLEAWLEGTGQLLAEMRNQHLALEAPERSQEAAEEHLSVLASLADDTRDYAEHAKENAQNAREFAEEARQQASAGEALLEEAKNLLSQADSRPR